MSMDAVRDDQHLTVYIDMPGVAADDLDVSVEQNELTVSAERRWRDDDKQVVASERPQGTFTRRLQLSDAFDMDGLEANLSEGVLEITVPISERSKQRKVEIGGGRHSEAIETSSSSDDGGN
jgi:HSP20 family protein